MNPAENYILSRPSPEREIMQYLHTLLRNDGLQARISYGIPMYYGNRWVCYLNPLKNGGIEWAFTRGNEFEDPSGLLQAKGRKLVRGWEIKSLSDINEGTIRLILQKALELDSG